MRTLRGRGLTHRGSVGHTTQVDLCTCVSEERGDGESVGSEELSLLSYTLRYVSLTDFSLGCDNDTPVDIREPRRGGQGGNGGG